MSVAARPVPAPLVDTNVLSELARPRPDPGVVAFFAGSPRVAVSVVVFHEVAYGLGVVADPELRGRLGAFVLDLRERFGADALPVTLTIAEAAGRLRALSKARGRVLTVADALIAGTAAVHALTLVTRNEKDFAGLNVPIHNPFGPA